MVPTWGILGESPLPRIETPRRKRNWMLWATTTVIRIRSNDPKQLHDPEHVQLGNDRFKSAAGR
jgi:hypothetical protein